MAHSNDALARALLVDATAELARTEGQSIRDDRVAQARRRVAEAASLRSDGDVMAFMAAGFLAITVLGPFLLGHFLLTKTFVLEADPGVYRPEARGIWDHFWATYLGGLVPIVLVLGGFLVARTPWQGRRLAVAIGWAAVFGSVIVLLPLAQSQWDDAEQKTIRSLRETAFPYGERFYDCASWKIHAENGVRQPELWQVHLGQQKGTRVDGCNRIDVYRGWEFVGAYSLPDGDVFTGDAVINHIGWSHPLEVSGSEEVWSADQKTGQRDPMNPVGTNVDLSTENGRRVEFSLDGAGAGNFHLR